MRTCSGWELMVEAGLENFAFGGHRKMDDFAYTLTHFRVLQGAC